jgi:hypothetical protein
MGGSGEREKEQRLDMTSNPSSSPLPIITRSALWRGGGPQSSLHGEFFPRFFPINQLPN